MRAANSEWQRRRAALRDDQVVKLNALEIMVCIEAVYAAVEEDLLEDSDVSDVWAMSAVEKLVKDSNVSFTTGDDGHIAGFKVDAGEE
jgi:hypothetical protein